MNILGITLFTHDSSATLIRNNKIIGCSEEERFSREKHTSKFPNLSIKFLLDEGGINSTDIDYVVIPHDPLKNYFSRIAFCLFNNKNFISAIKASFHNLLLFFKLKRDVKLLFQRHNMKLSNKCKIILFDHHSAHAASTFYVSGFNEAVVITWDGRGEWPCLTVSKASKQKVQKIWEQTVPDSLGQFYESVTNFLGFNSYGDEYKVMGLSAYGKPKFYKEIKNIISLSNSGKVKIDSALWRYNIYKRNFGLGYDFKIKGIKKRLENEKLKKIHLDLAASTQKVFNEIAEGITKLAYKKFNSNNLCLAGGVAQNILMNQKIYLNSGFENFFVQPASHDAGLSLGAALLTQEKYSRKLEINEFTAFQGPKFSNSEIKQILDTFGLSYFKPKNIHIYTAKLIAKNFVIGWFQGKTEFGPRALGSRSILADPRNRKMKEIVNRKIKFRENFRPFAPSILEDFFNKYFENAPKNEFMCFSADVRKEMRKIIPAVTHFDGTARPQVVIKSNNPSFWKLIRCFYEITKVPLLLNTSFNVQGEPIVNSPHDAIKCFFSSGIDYLILENFVIKK